MKQRLIAPDLALIMDFGDKGSEGDCICLDFRKRVSAVSQGGGGTGGGFGREARTWARAGDSHRSHHRVVVVDTARMGNTREKPSCRSWVH